MTRSSSGRTLPTGLGTLVRNALLFRRAKVTPLVLDLTDLDRRPESLECGERGVRDRIDLMPKPESYARARYKRNAAAFDARLHRFKTSCRLRPPQRGLYPCLPGWRYRYRQCCSRRSPKMNPFFFGLFLRRRGCAQWRSLSSILRPLWTRTSSVETLSRSQAPS